MQPFQKLYLSYNSSLNISQKQFLIPSWSLVSLYFLISTLLLVLLNISTIWNKFTSYLQVDTSLNEVVYSGSPFLQNIFEKLTRSRVPEIVLWLLVGCSVYILIWFVNSVIRNIMNDVVADLYLHPSSYNRKHYWEQVIARKAMLILCALVLIGYIYMFVKFLSVLAKYFYTSIDNFTPSSITEIVFSIIIVAFLIHLLIFLVHLAVSLWRLVYRS